MFRRKSNRTSPKFSGTKGLESPTPQAETPEQTAAWDALLGKIAHGRARVVEQFGDKSTDEIKAELRTRAFSAVLRIEESHFGLGKEAAGMAYQDPSIAALRARQEDLRSSRPWEVVRDMSHEQRQSLAAQWRALHAETAATLAATLTPFVEKLHAGMHQGTVPRATVRRTTKTGPVHVTTFDNPDDVRVVFSPDLLTWRGIPDVDAIDFTYEVSGPTTVIEVPKGDFGVLGMLQNVEALEAACMPLPD